MDIMPAGRPPKFKSAKDIEDKANAFFAECDAKDEPYTITGLALALDTTRETLCDYGKKDEFSDAIKRAKMTVHAQVEKRLLSGAAAAGAIFYLKNNAGWDETHNHNHNGKMELSLVNEFVEPQSPVGEGI